MPSYDQTPGALNLTFKRGDTLSALVDFSISMTGYTVTATLSSFVTGNTVATMTSTFVSAPDGKINVSLTKNQTAALTRGTYAWGVLWNDGSGTRTALSGFAEVL